MMNKNEFDSLISFLLIHKDSFSLFSQDFEVWKKSQNSFHLHSSISCENPILAPYAAQHPDRLLFLIDSYFCLYSLILFQELFDSDFRLCRFLNDQLSFDWLFQPHFPKNLMNDIKSKIRLQDHYSFDNTDDYLGKIYQKTIPKSIRQLRGEFFTPLWLADELSNRANQSFEDWRLQEWEKVNLKNQDRTITQKNFLTKKRDWANNNDWTSPLFEKNEKLNCKNHPKILDPSCGSGVFFLSMIRRWKEKNLPWKDILTLFVGLELNPVSVLMARVNILLELFRDCSIQKRQNAINDLADQYNKTSKPTVPIYLFDTIRNVCLQKEDQSSSFIKDNDFDIILGNPPWLNWDQLSAADRNATKPLWIKYGLFNLSGKEARYGGGKKELAALILYLSADRYLKKGGFLAMVLPQALFQTPKAGEGFRRFCLPESQEGDFSHLKLIEINDFSRTNPFSDVNSKVATLLLQKSDKPTEFPIPYFISKKATLLREKKWAEPIDQNRKGSPLIILNQKTNPDFSSNPPNTPNHQNDPFNSIVTKNIFQSNYATEKIYGDQKVEQINQDNANSINLTILNNSDNLGHSGNLDHSYRAQLGANTAGANGVYWLEILEQTSQSLIKVQNCFNVGKKKVELNQAELESELIYPLLRWRDVDEFYAEPSSFILIPQDSKTRKGICFELMSEKFPRSLEFLSNYETILKSRAAYQKFQSRSVYWSMYNINLLTFAPIKVVWRRMDKILRAAVITTDGFLRKPIIPQETISMVAVESLAEAHYLTAMLNSNEIRNKIESFSVKGSKGFGSPGILSLLSIPRFDPSNRSHLILSQHGHLKWEQKRTSK